MSATNAFAIVPIAAESASLLRTRLVDDDGNALTPRHDDARHQCRSCLSLTTPGEGFLLVSHRPFPTRQPYAERGPVFVHERNCVPYADPSVYPPEFPHHAVVLRAYDERDEIAGAELVGEREPEDVIRRLFDDPRVAYLHARNSTYGCYMFRVDRG